MSGPIVQLGAEHFDEAMAFINRAFSEHGVKSLRDLHPSLYQAEDGLMRNHYVILEQGRIASLVGLYPRTLRVGDVTLRMAGIGAVSTAPELRGRGLMAQLMTHVRSQIQRQGFDLSYLGGSRQRYRRFGWEICGSQLGISLGKPAALSNADTGLEFERAEEDTSTLARLKELCDAQAIYCERPLAEFGRFLHTWLNVPWVAKNSEGSIVGYLVANDEGNDITELVAESDDVLMAMARGWTHRLGRSARFNFPGLPSRVLTELSEIGEWFSFGHSGNWQIFNYAKVIDALLRLRHRAEPLPLGEVLIGVENEPHSLHIEVREGSAGCALRERPAAQYFEPMRLSRVLFGPSPPSLVTHLEPGARALHSWCPLPLSISYQDAV